ncbi:hypothetical protein NBRC116494_06730 [Aurantivibrio plasticivorans]
MRHLFRASIVVITLTLALPCWADRENTAVILVNDDSGLVTDIAKFSAMRIPLLAQIKHLRTKREFARAKFEVISTSYARTVFVGTIADLKGSRAQEILDVTQNNATYCNNLRGTFKAVRSRLLQLEQQGYTSLYVYFFSNLIDAPAPCQDVLLKLPQIPVKVNFAEIFGGGKALKALAFYNVNPHQAPLYQEATQVFAGIASQNNIAFAIFDEAASAHELTKVGLWGIE